MTDLELSVDPVERTGEKVRTSDNRKELTRGMTRRSDKESSLRSEGDRAEDSTIAACISDYQSSGPISGQ